MEISVYIIAYNEADKIHDCINSVLWADEIIVIDSNSTDETPKIAKDLGAKVVNVTFDGFGKLRNKAISYCTKDWILSIDSDERCTRQVRDEILALIEKTSLDIFRIPRKNYFMGKWIKFSGWYPNYRQPQLFRTGKMNYDLNKVHEGYISNSDHEIGTIKNSIWQFPFKNAEEIIQKADSYSTLGASKLNIKGVSGGVMKAFLHGLWSFVKHYFLKLGFLDGGAGFVIAFGNFEGTFYRYIKLAELQSNWKKIEVKPIRKVK